MAGTKNFREDFTRQSSVIKTSKIRILVQMNAPHSPVSTAIRS